MTTLVIIQHIRRKHNIKWFCIGAVLMALSCTKKTDPPSGKEQQTDPMHWGKQVLVNNVTTYNDEGPEARSIHPGTFGSQYARLLPLKNGDWLAVYTVYRNNGYTHDSKGGTELEISRSRDNGRSWSAVTTISDSGRDLDNGQMIQLDDGSILLAARSVRWQESYRLPVYKSMDQGKLWTYVSSIDANEGMPGSLGNPDKGIYEPHMVLLSDGKLSVMYANETHVTESPSYSQIISQKISPDGGASWGEEIWVAAEPGAARPGMPVWARMENGKYIVVFEVCGTRDCDIFYKTSPDGVSWLKGLGTQIPGQVGGPYILSLSDRKLLVTSNSSNMSLSNDNGKHWKLIERAWTKTLWPSLYQTGTDEVCAANSVPRDEGGNNIQLRFGNIK